jgi:hypothetical protein
MNKEILKPTISKILVSWLVMSLVIIVFIIMFNWRDFTDFIGTIIVVLVAFFQCFIFCLIFYNLPYFKIEINDTQLIGPRGFGGGWQRIQIPLEDIDVQNINTRFQWLGFYMIKSKTGGKLSVWGFDEKQYKKLITLIVNRGLKTQ